MDFIFELIFELLFEGAIDVSSNRKIGKWIRYPLILLIALVFAFVTGIIFFAAVLIYDKSIVVSIFFVILDLALLIGSIMKFKKIYLSKKDK